LDRLPLSNGGSSVRVFETGRPYRTGHADQDPDELKGITQGLHIRSILAAPIDVDTTRRGLLQVDSAREDHFSADDLEFLQAVARWIGLVLVRAELVELVRSEAVAQARRMAAEELVAIIAHDLRGPLTPLRGYLSMLAKEAERAGLPASMRYVSASQRAVERLDSMVGNLLDTARLEQGIFELSRQVVDVADLARETVSLLATPEVPIDVRGPEALLLDADPERLRQALENLLANALRHSPAGAQVVVDLEQQQREDGAWAVLTVRDSGPGISAELLPRLFTRFVRGEGSQGLGLGLYLVRGIAEAHGGTLTVESSPDKGSAFRLELPADGKQY
jgi:two-component system, OmpR family, sensor kinase